jgi:hypothetical protein
MPRRGVRKLVQLSRMNASNITPLCGDFQGFGALRNNRRTSIRATAPSNNVVRLGRIFRERLEVDHHPIDSSDDWEFTFHHVGGHGRRFISKLGDVAEAFYLTCAFRNQGVRVVCVDRGRP